MKRALIQMHLAVVLWGFTGVLGKAISLDAPVLVWYRMLFTAIIVAVIIHFRRQWVRPSRADLIQLTAVGVLMSLHWVAFYGSIKFSNISIALVCLSTASIFTSLLDPIVNKGRYDVKEILLGSLALAGVSMIYSFQKFYGAGIFFGVAAAVLSAVFTVLNKKIASRYPSRTMVFYEMSTGWIFLSLLVPLLLYWAPDTRLIPSGGSLYSDGWMHNDWLWLIILSLCCTVWAQSLALNALKELSSFTVTLSVNLEPIYGILLAFICYNENREVIFQLGTSELNWGFLGGMALIMLSVVLQMIRLLRPGAATKGFVRERGGID